jgi:hypothetical protein
MIIATGILVGACATVSVKSDYDKSIDFSAFKTYQWSQGDTPPGDAFKENPFLRDRVIKAINKHLQEKGFEQQDSDLADLSISVYAMVEEKTRGDEWNAWDRSGWYNPRWGPYGGDVEASQYRQGTLVVDIVNMSAKELVWRGLGYKTIKEIAKDQNKVDEIVAKIFADFPPKAKKGVVRK